MKVFLLLAITVWSLSGFAQTSAQAEELSRKIAKRMKDTLDLTADQQQAIFQVNMQLFNQKQAARQQYTNTDSLRSALQRIENSRDSLYNTLMPVEKYLMYRNRKRYLVTNN